MLKPSEWFGQQLQASADGFVWGMQQLPSERHFATPPKGLGEWSAARHAFHLTYYERMVALPSMKQWLGSEYPTETELDEEAALGLGRKEAVAWSERDRPQHDVQELLVQFKKVRKEQIELLPIVSDSAWDTFRETLFGSVTLLWVVSKTFQHTAEHISDVLRLALTWDRYEGSSADAAANTHMLESPWDRGIEKNGVQR